MSVRPISSPASALISSSATGSLSTAYTCVASEPPAFGCGTTFTISAPGTAARSVMMARFQVLAALHREENTAASRHVKKRAGDLPRRFDAGVCADLRADDLARGAAHYKDASRLQMRPFADLGSGRRRLFIYRHISPPLRLFDNTALFQRLHKQHAEDKSRRALHTVGQNVHRRRHEAVQAAFKKDSSRAPSTAPPPRRSKCAPSGCRSSR